MTSFQIASPLRTLRAPAPVTPEAHVLRAGFAGEQANITPGRLEPEHYEGTENARQSSDDMSVGSTLPVDSQVWGQTITFLATATPPRSPEDANREGLDTGDQYKIGGRDSRATTDLWTLEGCKTPEGQLRGSKEAVGESFLDELTRGNEGGLWQSPVRTREGLDDAFKITLHPSRIPCPCPSPSPTRPRNDFWADALQTPFQPTSCADPIPSADSIFDSPPISPLHLASADKQLNALNPTNPKRPAAPKETPMLNWMSRVKHGLDTIGMTVSQKTGKNTMETHAEVKAAAGSRPLKTKPNLNPTQTATHPVSSRQLAIEARRAERSSATPHRAMLAAQPQAKKGPLCFGSPARSGTIFEGMPTTPESYTVEKRQAEHEDDFRTPKGRQYNSSQSPRRSLEVHTRSSSEVRLSQHQGVNFGRNQTPSRHDLVLESPIRPPSISSVPSTRRSLSSMISRVSAPGANRRHFAEEDVAAPAADAAAVPLLKVDVEEEMYDVKERQLLEKHVGTNPDYVEEWLACKAQAAFLAHDFEALLQHQNLSGNTPDNSEEEGGAEVTVGGHSSSGKRAKGTFKFDAKRKWNQVVRSLVVSTKTLSGYAKKKFTEGNSNGRKSSPANLENASSVTQNGAQPAAIKKPNSKGGRSFRRVHTSQAAAAAVLADDDENVVESAVQSRRRNHSFKTSPVRKVVLTKPVPIELDGIVISSSLDHSIFKEGEKILEIDGKFVSSEKNAVDLLFRGAYPIEVKVIPAASTFSDV